MQQFGANRAPALENLNVQLPVKAVAGTQAQRRGRGFVLRGIWAAQKDQSIAVLGMDLQAANLLLTGLGQPGNDSAGSVGLDQLFGDPEAVRRRVGLNPD